MPCPLKGPFQHGTVVGRITELLAEHEFNGSGIATIEEFVVAPTRHKGFGMPYLVWRQEDPSFIIVHTKVFLPRSTPYNYVSVNSNRQDIEFDFNVQHDCSFAGCGPTGKRPHVQERVKSTEATESFVEHRNDGNPRWIINTHSLHNGHLLRRCFPQHLVAPIPLIDPAKREEEHRKISAEYRPTHEAKLAEANQKRAAKRPKKEVKGEGKVPKKQKPETNGDGLETDVVMGVEG